MSQSGVVLVYEHTADVWGFIYTGTSMFASYTFVSTLVSCDPYKN
jgi:hypothetical protein